LSNNNNHPDLQRAEKAVTTAEAAVSKAQETVVDLEKKRAASVQRDAELADDRANVALAAHTGDDKAAKRLQEIHQAIAVHGSELASIDAAIRVAGTKIKAAQAVVVAEVQKVNALKLRTRHVHSLLSARRSTRR
jgi:multidrug resistance efflux pump